MDRQYLDKSCEAANFAVAVASAGGFVSALAHSYRDGWWGNQFPAMWLCIVGAMLAAQSHAVYKRPELTCACTARRWAWLAYGAFMAATGAVALAGYALVPQPGAASVSPVGWWALAWFPALGFLLLYSRLHWEQRGAGAVGAAPREGSPPKQAPAAAEQQGCPKAPARLYVVPEAQQHADAAGAGTPPAGPAPRPLGGVEGRWCSGWPRAAAKLGLRALGWSSIGLAAALAFLLALQAAWLAADQRALPAAAYGQLVVVPVDNTDYQASVFIRCVGPHTPGLSTFVLEADAGQPAASLFGLQDELARAGRRSCSYDRLGSGWSDDLVTPSHLKRIPFTLRSLMAAAGNRTGDAPPFILAGHGHGGQLALQFASLWPELVSGLALLDSYSATAWGLERGLIANKTDSWGNTRYHFLSSGHVRAQLARASAARAAAPLAWARLARRRAWPVGPPYAYRAAVEALRSSNKAPQGRWGELAGAAAALPDSVDEQLTLSAPQGDSFWHGTGWRDFGPMPVAVLPAEDTLAGAGCDVTLAPCQRVVAIQPGQYLAKLAAAYNATLSANASLELVPGGHGYPWQAPAAAAALLAARFAGV